LAPIIQTVCIKPPAQRSIKSIIKHTDTSFNTEIYIIKLLSKEVKKKQNKIHKIIVMIGMGDFREGVMGEYSIK
jgi:predicted amino acid racemase